MQDEVRRRARGLVADPLRRDLTLIVGAFAVLRMYAVFGVGAVRGADTPQYFNIDFIGHAERLWTVPLFFNLFPSDASRVVGMALLGAVSWGALAVSMAAWVRNPIVARLGALLIALLGLSHQVTQWDAFMYSESVTMSLTALLIAALLEARRRPSYVTVIAALTVTMLWIFTKHQNALFFLLLAPFVLAWLWLRAPRALAAVTTSGIVVFGGWALLALNGNDWVRRVNTLSIIHARIVPDPGSRAYFTSRGMPMTRQLLIEARCSRTASGALQCLGTKDAGSTARLFFHDRTLNEWIDEKWTRTYLTFLASHPGYTLREPLAEAPDVLSTDFNLTQSRAVLPPPLQDLVFSRTPGDLPFLLLVVGTLLLLARPRSRSGPPYGILLIGAALTLYLITFLGGVGDTTRVQLPVAVTLRIGIVLALISCIDRLVHNPKADKLTDEYAERSASRPRRRAMAPGSTDAFLGASAA